ncbi:hypothetical protein H9P43_005541 [Blastocladiella emersonii ATCC 22665]|nr:hypothetical protein H9P43_005541 [Blastocladiella emersonii ATCC 22665]
MSASATPPPSSSPAHATRTATGPPADPSGAAASPVARVRSLGGLGGRASSLSSSSFTTSSSSRSSSSTPSSAPSLAASLRHPPPSTLTAPAPAPPPWSEHHHHADLLLPGTLARTPPAEHHLHHHAFPLPAPPPGPPPRLPSQTATAPPAPPPPAAAVPDPDVSVAASLRFSRYPVVDHEARALACTIVDQYVTKAWFCDISTNRDFQRALLHALAHAMRAIEDRILQVDWASVLLVDIPLVLQQHYAAYSVAQTPLLAHLTTSTLSAARQPAPPGPPTPPRVGSSMSLNVAAANRSSGSTGPPTHQRSVSSPTAPTFRPLHLNPPPPLPRPPSNQNPTPAAPPPPDPGPGWTARHPRVRLAPLDVAFQAYLPHAALEPDPTTADKSGDVELPHFNEYLRTVANVVVTACLPPASLDADAERLLVRELVAGVLALIFDAGTDPVVLFQAITAAAQRGGEGDDGLPRAGPRMPHWTTIAHWVWYHTSVLWHTILHRLRGWFASPPSPPPSAPPSARGTPALHRKPFANLRSRVFPAAAGTAALHQLDVPLVAALDHVVLFASSTATRWAALLWHLWLRPPLRFFAGSWVDRYLVVAAMRPLTAGNAARGVRWIAGLIRDSAPAAPATSAATPEAEIDVWRARAASVVPDALRPVVRDHTFGALASAFRNRHLLVRLVDVLVAKVFVRTTATAATAARGTSSAGADAMALTGRNHRGGNGGSGGSGGSRSRRTGDAVSSSGGVPLGSSTASSTASAGASVSTTTVKGITASLSPAALAPSTRGTVARHQRSRSTGGSPLSVPPTTATSTTAATAPTPRSRSRSSAGGKRHRLADFDAGEPTPSSSSGLFAGLLQGAVPDPPAPPTHLRRKSLTPEMITHMVPLAAPGNPGPVIVVAGGSNSAAVAPAAGESGKVARESRMPPVPSLPARYVLTASSPAAAAPAPRPS